MPELPGVRFAEGHDEYGIFVGKPVLVHTQIGAYLGIYRGTTEGNNLVLSPSIVNESELCFKQGDTGQPNRIEPRSKYVLTEFPTFIAHQHATVIQPVTKEYLERISSGTQIIAGIERKV